MNAIRAVWSIWGLIGDLINRIIFLDPKISSFIPRTMIWSNPLASISMTQNYVQVWCLIVPAMA